MTPTLSGRGGRLRGPSAFAAVALAIALLTAFPARAQPPSCTAASTGLCSIEFDELVAGVPLYLRTATGLDLADEPVAVPRIAIVWPGDGTLTHPPVVVYSDGHGGTAVGSSTSSRKDFHVEWPEAIVAYVEASRLVDHDGYWRPDGHSQLGDTDWSPRFPYIEETADVSDLDYLDRVLATVSDLFPYDTERVYAAGHSSGGFFTLSLMSLRPEVFRAFAAVGTYADYERQGNDIAAIVAAGQKLPSRPILYMMGEKEDVFSWQPANPGASDRVYETVRQLTARNGAEVPRQGDTDYLVDLTNDVRAAAPADRVESLAFEGVKPNSAEVVMLVYGGDHSWPQQDADDPALRATEWAVDFFQRHDTVPPLEPNVLFDQGWTVPVLMHPTFF